MDAHGELERLKARLVTCGNEQVFGVDYQLTFATVMDMSTMKVILRLLRQGVSRRSTETSPTRMSRPTRKLNWRYFFRCRKQ